MELTLDKIAKEVAEKALDEITYEGKTIREWVEIIVKQQSCKNYIGKEALIDELKLGYFNKELQEAKNDPCVIDAMIDWAIRTVKRQSSVTPTISKMEQVEDCISREDAIGIVARIKGMHIDDRERYQINYGTICDIDLALQQLPPVSPQPFINKPCVSEGVCHEDKMQVLDKIRVEIDAKIVRRPWLNFEDKERDRNDAFLEVLQIIDKYKTEESEGK